MSLEGSVIVERKDANKKFYNANVSAAQLLGGSIPAPPAADALTRILRSRIFRGAYDQHNDADMYNDMPVYDEDRDSTVWEGRTGSAYGEGRRNSFGNGSSGPSRTTWHDDVYDREPTHNSPRRSNTVAQPRNNRLSRGSNPDVSFDTIGATSSQQFQRQHFSSTYSDHGPTPGSANKGPPPARPTAPKPARPTAPKPVFNKPAPQLGPNQAVAQYTFEGDQAGDLSFKKVCFSNISSRRYSLHPGFKGDIITITKRTDSKNVRLEPHNNS